MLQGLARNAVAQGPTGLEFGVQALATLADPSFAGGGISFSVRPEDRTRFAAAITPGARDRRFALRGDLLLEYMLDPARFRGVGVYGLGGVAGVTGRSGAGYIVLGIGVESAPGGSSGWAAEVGMGGGVRFTLGWRRRWLHRPGRMP